MTLKSSSLSRPIALQRSFNFDRLLNTFAAWCLAVIWLLPLLYAIWTAFHPSEFETQFDILAPLTFKNFIQAWNEAPLQDIS